MNSIWREQTDKGGKGMSLQGQVALISGAGSGIGRASAKLLAKEGARIGVLDNRMDELEATVADILRDGGEAIPLLADVSDPAQVQDSVRRLVDRWGRLDVLFANAGINGITAPIEEIEPEEWDRVMNINLKGTFLMFKYAVPHLKQRGGSAIITSSMQGTRVFTSTGTTAYACTKAAQAVFAKKMALELGRFNIRVNVICPGSTNTNINSSSQTRNLDKIRIRVDFPDGKIPLISGRKVETEEVARLVLFLADGQSYPITGSEIAVDGGMSLLMG
jgi:NAD(P)-dependent dehydrogenase (short-subunit alcohol dehydrogenase family)